MGNIQICTCGLLKQQLANVGGVQTCTRCNKPAEISLARVDEARAAAEEFRSTVSLEDIESNVTTLHFLPGHKITASHGVVYASMSHTKWKANTQKARLTTAFDGALGLLLEQAHSRRANAIVGLQFAANSSEGGTAVFGGSSDAIVVMGSAVTVVPESDS